MYAITRIFGNSNLGGSARILGVLAKVYSHILGVTRRAAFAMCDNAVFTSGRTSDGGKAVMDSQYKCFLSRWGGWDFIIID
jgi:hypothetical protein